MRDWFGFAGIGPPDVPMIQREQQFAEKLLAYTLPRTTPNSRVRDLVDMVLLIQSGTLESSRVVQALHATFGRRQRTPFPKLLLRLRRNGQHHSRGWQRSAVWSFPFPRHSGSLWNSARRSEDQ